MSLYRAQMTFYSLLLLGAICSATGLDFFVFGICFMAVIFEMAYAPTN